jgi:hypothetical protein
MNKRSINFSLSLVMVAGAGVVRSQVPAAAPAAPAINIDTFDVIDRHGTLDLNLTFDSILDLTHPEDLTDSNITILGTPSKSRMVLARIRPIVNTQIEISLTGAPPGTDTAVNVCFQVLHFSKLGDPKKYTSPAGKPVCKTSNILTQDQAKALANQLNAAAAKAKADKTSSEKDIFASGFVTTAGQSKTQGGADISLNNFLSGLPGANTFLQIQKSSLSGGDPRHFEVGLSWRHVILFDPALDKQIADEVNKFEQGGSAADQAALGAKIAADAQSYGPWLGAIGDFAIKIEGDPTKFQAANAVGDADFRVLTRTLKLFGSSNGYFRARPLVIGFEGGRSIGQGDTTTTTTGTATSTTTPNVNWIARGKAGADFTLYFHNPQTKGPIKRLEINAGGVERYLFFKEINYDPTTKKDSQTGKGSRPYFQSDLKLFFFEDTKGRYGLRTAYTRGSLPPVFADVKSFQFGFVFETNDDKSK